jgi:hypothetical protein
MIIALSDDRAGGLSFICSVFLVLISLSLGIDLKSYKHTKTCEQSLPRNQHCKIIAVPELAIEENK